MAFLNESNGRSGGFLNMIDSSNLINIRVGDELTFNVGGQHSIDDKVFVFKIDYAKDEVVLANIQKDVYPQAVESTLDKINNRQASTSKFTNVVVDGILKYGGGEWMINPDLQDEYCSVSDELNLFKGVSNSNNRGLAYTSETIGYANKLKGIDYCEEETRASGAFLLLTFNTLNMAQMKKLGFYSVAEEVEDEVFGDESNPPQETADGASITWVEEVVHDVKVGDEINRLKYGGTYLQPNQMVYIKSIDGNSVTLSIISETGKLKTSDLDVFMDSVNTSYYTNRFVRPFSKIWTEPTLESAKAYCEVLGQSITKAGSLALRLLDQVVLVTSSTGSGRSPSINVPVQGGSNVTKHVNLAMCKEPSQLVKNYASVDSTIIGEVVLTKAQMAELGYNVTSNTVEPVDSVDVTVSETNNTVVDKGDGVSQGSNVVVEDIIDLDDNDKQDDIDKDTTGDIIPSGNDKELDVKPSGLSTTAIAVGALALIALVLATKK